MCSLFIRVNIMSLNLKLRLYDMEYIQVCALDVKRGNKKRENIFLSLIELLVHDTKMNVI